MDKLEELRQKNLNILTVGGEESIQAQHASGKKTARERIQALLDPDSFVEIDKFVKRGYVTPGFEAASVEGEGVVCGYGTMDERPIFVFAQDYTALSGSISVAHAQKIIKTLDMAVKNGIPVVGVLDSGGARVAEGIAAVDSYAGILKKLNDVSGVIPTICVVAGPCIGSAAYLAASMDFCFMVEKIAAVALHGPQIYASALGKPVDAIDFGTKNHSENTGIAQVACADEDGCFAAVKKLVSFLPANNLEEAPFVLCTDDLNRQMADHENAYDAKGLIAAIADHNDVFELSAGYSTEVTTMLGRLNGMVVGFVANVDCKLTGHGARKVSRFVSLMDAYNIPIVTLVHCDGTEFNLVKEQGMLIANAATLIAAYAEAGVPKITLITGKAMGDGYVMMCPKALGADMVYAYPYAQISAMPAQAAALIFYEKEISEGASKDEMIQRYLEEQANPWQAAQQGVIDDVIDPALTRPVLVSALEMSITKRETKLSKKHCVLPL